MPREIAVLVLSDRDVPGFTVELARHPRYRPVGRVPTVADAAQAVRAHEPDVLLVEVDTLERLAALAAEAGRLRGPAMVVVCALPPEVSLLACMAVGAAAYVSEPVVPGVLVNAVDCVTRGHMFIDPRSTDWLVRFALDGFRTGRREALTLRQAQVVELVRTGLTNRQIAVVLGLSAETVKSHLHAAMRRLGVHDRWTATASMDRRRNGSAGHPGDLRGARRELS